MPLVPISTPPGVALSMSNYSVGKTGANVQAGDASRPGQGRWTTGSNVEFVAGYPQKIAGWVSATSSLTEGIPRAVKIWRDHAGSARVGIGTETHLYSLSGSDLTDITPLRSIANGTLNNAITTTNASSLVAITDAAQTLVDGDWVYLSAAAAVGGLLIVGWYSVSGRSGSGYNITATSAATSGAGPAGGTILFQYPRRTLTDPFTTTADSATVSVADVAHGAAAGNFVTFSNAASVGGLTIDGEYEIATITDADNYTITASSPAVSSAGPGGGAVSVTYDIQVQQSELSAGATYGTGAYGVGPYGIGVATTAVLANGWTLAPYGSQLLACPIGGTIYVYDTTVGGRAYPLLNAPTSINAMFVTPERFVVALGITNNLMEMAWADQNDYTVWVTLPTNTANSGRTLIGGSYFTGGVAVRDGVSLIFTDRCAFQMNYTGDNEVYNTPQIGDNCGLVSPTAACTVGGVVYWMSTHDFWQWNGGVAPLPTDDVRNYLFNGAINRSHIQVSTAAVNQAKRQVRFWFPSTSATENDIGTIYHYDQQCFSPLSFGRSAAIDSELLTVPVSADTTGAVYYDETGTDANGAALSYDLEFGFVDISNGDRNADIMGMIPDFQTIVGTVDLTILTKFYPNDTATLDGPYSLTSSTQRIDLRSDGKLFGFALSGSAIGNTFRLGLPRLDVQPGGART